MRPQATLLTSLSPGFVICKLGLTDALGMRSAQSRPLGASQRPGSEQRGLRPVRLLLCTNSHNGM